MGSVNPIQADSERVKRTVTPIWRNCILYTVCVHIPTYLYIKGENTQRWVSFAYYCISVLCFCVFRIISSISSGGDIVKEKRNFHSALLFTPSYNYRTAEPPAQLALPSKCNLGYFGDVAKDLTVDKFKVFLDLHYMDMVQISRFQDYWKNDKFFNINIFREQRSRNGFLLIFRSLHFLSKEEDTDEHNKDVLRKIRKVVEYFNKQMETIYYPR